MKLIDAISGAKKVLIVGHVRPDGDCFGSGFAIKRLLEKSGSIVDFVVDSPLPNHYSFMEEYSEVNVIKNTSYDLAISVDCADELRLGKYYGVFSKVKRTVNIDHHITNTSYAKINFVNEVSSTCELLYYLIKDDVQLDDYMASCLYVGLSTDTGHFKHNNVTEKTFTMASNLIKYNFDTQYIHN